jgi:hypothetical protein
LFRKCAPLAVRDVTSTGQEPRINQEHESKKKKKDKSGTTPYPEQATWRIAVTDPGPVCLWLLRDATLPAQALAGSRELPSLPGSSSPFLTLSASCPLVPAPLVPLCARFLPAILVGASVTDAAVPAGERVLAAGLVHSCLSPLSMPPSSRVARRCPSAPSRMPRPKPLWGKAWSPICFFLHVVESQPSRSALLQ